MMMLMMIMMMMMIVIVMVLMVLMLMIMVRRDGDRGGGRMSIGLVGGQRLVVSVDESAGVVEQTVVARDPLVSLTLDETLAVHLYERELELIVDQVVELVEQRRRTIGGGDERAAEQKRIHGGRC